MEDKDIAFLPALYQKKVHAWACMGVRAHSHTFNPLSSQNNQLTILDKSVFNINTITMWMLFTAE